MASYKNARAAEDIRRELSDIMRDLKDPRITGMLSIVKLDLSSDYSYCTVFISSLEGIDAAKSAVQGLISASGFIHREMRSRLRLRRIPEFKFIADGGIAYSADISKLLNDL